MTAEPLATADGAVTEPLAPAAVVRASRLARLGTPLNFLFAVALFALGVGLGVAAYGRVHPPVVAGARQAAPLPDGTTTAPAVVQELISAIRSGQSDAVRSALQDDPYRLYAGELERRGFQEVTGVDTLGTIVDGNRSVTELFLRGTDTSGSPLGDSLVVQVQDGLIVSFR